MLTKEQLHAALKKWQENWQENKDTWMSMDDAFSVPPQQFADETLPLLYGYAGVEVPS